MSESYPTALHCANHPDVETSLRCQRCEKPICVKCAVRTPTGYKCRECVRGQQKVFETAQWYDYPLAILIAGGLSMLGGLIAPRMGFFIIFLAPIAGGIIAEAVRAVIRRHRSRQLFLYSAVAAGIGGILPVLGSLGLSLIFAGGGINIYALLIGGVYAFIVTSTMYYRLSGLQLGR